MKYLICLALVVAIGHSDACSQRSNTLASDQYAFIMVINKENTKLYFSAVFIFMVDTRGNPEYDLNLLENRLQEKSC
jgi:hypothetical protein